MAFTFGVLFSQSAVAQKRGAPQVTGNATSAPRSIHVDGWALSGTATSTLGQTIGAAAVTQLPLSTRNYTQILALSAGTNTGANNATAFGKCTQNM